MAASRLTVPFCEINVDTPNRSAILKEFHSHTSTANILGRGSYGTVIKAVYKGKQVAVKVLHSNQESKISTIENEANVLGWENENIIKIHKIDFCDHHGIVIMERFPGQCLQSILDSLKIPLYHRILITLDILSGLDYCHCHSVVHLDIKPQNILVAFTVVNKSHGKNKNYICKLCDFGSSLKLNLQNETYEHVMGTVRYMSPEALKRNKITPAADIYSLGITMWQLKSRKYPYASIKSNEIVIYKVIKDDLRPDSVILAKPSTFSTPELHDNCLCEHFSSDLSNQSADNTSELIASTKLLRSSPKLLTQKRSPFMNLNKKLNISSTSEMNLKNSKKAVTGEFVNSLTPRMDASMVIIKLTDENGRQMSKNDGENANILGVEYDLKNIFKKSSFKNKDIVKQTEDLYEKLYRSCWNRDAEMRAKASALKEDLLYILSRYS